MAYRVLVIDDSEMIIALVSQALTEAGFQVAAATNLAELDQRLAEGTYDLALVDVNMPEMYGDDVVEFLRLQRKLDAKLLLHSDIPEDELASKVAASGADGYVLKSKGVEHILTQVRQYESADRAQQPRKKRVLIVDDSEVTASLIQAELSAKGIDVAVADSADKATRIILKKQTRPDLVLLDVRMPNVDGEQFCRFIKSNSLFSGIKVLLCSGENVEELQRICREAGADGYVPKDAVLSKLLSQAL